MTATTATPPTPLRPTGVAFVRLVRAEMLKIFTTSSWWIFGLITLATTALTLTLNVFADNSEIDNAEFQATQPPPDFGQNAPPGQEGPSNEDIERMERQYRESIDIARILVRSAANIYTSGQFFGLLFMVILGALIVTNEFFHQTATTTFLTTPHRSYVILSKLVAAMLLATTFWLVITVIDVGVGTAFFALTDHGIPLTDWPVLRSVLMNLLAFVIWTVLGVGLGVLIRSQLGATLTGAALYLLSWPVAASFFGLIRAFVIKEDWVWNWIVSVPGVASMVMITPEPLSFGNDQGGPQWWVGGLVLLGYGVVAGVVGTLITRKRDIS